MKKLAFSLALTCLLLFLLTLGRPAPLTAAPRATARMMPPPSWVLGPMQGWSGTEADVNWILDQYVANGIPLSVFHFDAWDWETCNNSGNFKFSNTLVQRLSGMGVRAIFWIMPLIDQTKCASLWTSMDAQGYFVQDTPGHSLVITNWEGTGSWVDFTKPAAVAFWHTQLDQVVAQTGSVFGGFYMDDVASVQQGLPAGYFDTAAMDFMNYVRSKIPDGDVIVKRDNPAINASDAFLSQYPHAAYVGDLGGDFAGMQTGISRIFDASTLLPAPMNEFGGYSSILPPDTETYVRRMHFGAFQPIMENDPAPWTGLMTFPYSMPQYKFYTTLHAELVPYFHSYDRIAYETGTPIFRQPDKTTFSTKLGDGIFASYVTTYTTSLSVTLPVGQWVNYWDETQLYTGPTTINLPVPVGQEPTFWANGSLIPMQVQNAFAGHGTSSSAGSLTVSVLPGGGASTSPYYDRNGYWVTLEQRNVGTALTLCARPGPSQPLIYRVLRWTNAPARVVTLGGAVGINLNWGVTVPPLASEQAVDASASGWYFDAGAHRLFVKISTPGDACPTGTQGGLFAPAILSASQP